MKRSEILFGIAKIPADFFMTILAFLLAYKLRLLTETLKGFAKPIDYSVLPTPREYMNFSIWLALAIIIIFMLGKMYNLKTTEKFSKEIKKTILLWIIWAMAIITYFFFTRTLPFSRLAILYSWTLALIFIIFGRGIIRIIQKIFLYAGIGRRKLLFIGKNSIAEELKKHFEKDKNYKIFGVMDNQNISNLEELIKKK
ncbi:hypothetical protein HZC20_01315 [Candidatus Peregrinibacteria bacterium]|nr:hypothetical protein [Candidatus Peregrinibacteria bacterium]